MQVHFSDIQTEEWGSVLLLQVKCLSIFQSVNQIPLDYSPPDYIFLTNESGKSVKWGRADVIFSRVLCDNVTDWQCRKGSGCVGNSGSNGIQWRGSWNTFLPFHSFTFSFLVLLFVLSEDELFCFTFYTPITEALQCCALKGSLQDFTT